MSAMWELIDVNMIVQSFQQCGISNTVHDTEDHLIRDDVSRDIDMDEDNDEDSASLNDNIDELEFFSDSDWLILLAS